MAAGALGSPAAMNVERATSCGSGNLNIITAPIGASCDSSGYACDPGCTNVVCIYV
jgi:hypothetical protein